MTSIAGNRFHTQEAYRDGVSRWATVMALFAVAFAVAAPTSMTRGALNDAVHNCRTRDLTIRLVHSGAAAGTVGGYIGFTNRARGRCRLGGWPTLVAVSAAGTSTTAQHRRSTMFGPRPSIVGVPNVTLRHGQRVDAVFTAGDNPGPGEATCPPPYRRLRVTPPGNVRSVLLSAWLPYLGAYLPACTLIEVSFVVGSSDLYHD
jgi:hypothetical protein